MKRLPGSAATALLVGVFALLRTVGLAPASSASSEAEGEPASSSLLLVTLDTVRADHLGSYGWPHARTPTLDALAARGTRFVRVDTSVPVTLPSHASIFTGLHPPRHGVRDNGTFVLGPEATTVAERLRSRGHDTAAAVSAAVVARRYGLDQGFHHYDDDLPATGKTVERDASATTDAALALVRELRKPFLLWVHYFDPHDPYEAPADLRETQKGPTADYDAEIAHVDRELARLLDEAPEDTVIVVVGDHGEMLGDHGEPTHGIFPYRGARRVPLILAGPGIPSASVGCLVRTVDIAPTLLELAGAPVPEGLDGESLLSLLDAPGECVDRPGYTESFQPFFTFAWYPLRSFSDGRWLLVHGPEDRLFDLESAEGEARDVAAGHPETARRLRARLVRILEAMGEPLQPEIAPDVAPTGEEAARLRSLGYVAGGKDTRRIDGELPDPHDRIEVVRDLYEASRAAAAGRCREALPTLVSVARRDPANFPALNAAGLCLLELGRLQSARNAFRRALELQPSAVEPAVNLATTLLRMGRPGEAEPAFRRGLELDPGNATAAGNLARILRESDRPEEARRVVDGALAAGGEHPLLLLERGLLRLADEDLEGALQDLSAAGKRAPDDPAVWRQVAGTALELDELETASRAARELIRILPEEAGPWALRAEIARRRGDRKATTDSLEEAIRRESDPGERRRLEKLLQELRDD